MYREMLNCKIRPGSVLRNVRQIANSYHRTVRGTFLPNAVPAAFVVSHGQSNTGETGS